MNAQRHGNMSGLHLNWGTNIPTENILFYLNKFCSIHLYLRLVSNLKKCSVGSDF